MINYEDLGRLNEPFFAEYKTALEETLRSGWFILGEKVRTFENEFANYCGSRYCTGLASGLDALLLALKALDIPEGSEVIVPSNTYIATILAIVNAGCTPVLVEPDLVTYNIDPDKLEEKISDKTRAVIVVHLYGKICAMDKITEVCKRNSLSLIEDCAQAHGAAFKGVKAGTFGDAGAFSFYPTKNLGALGDAGALTTNDEGLDASVRSLRNYGSTVKYFNDRVGYNSRLDEIQAAFLSVKLKKLDLITAHKRELAGLYSKYLKNDFIKPDDHPDYFDVFHIYNVRHPRRDELKKYLEGRSIKTEIHYPVPPHLQPAYKQIFKAGSYPISELIHSTTLSLPVSFYHKESDIEQVIEVMNKF